MRDAPRPYGGHRTDAGSHHKRHARDAAATHRTALSQTLLDICEA